MFNIVVIQSKGTKLLILHKFVGKWTQILVIGYMSGNATLDDYFVADVKQWALGLFWATNVYFMILFKKVQNCHILWIWQLCLECAIQKMLLICFWFEIEHYCNMKSWRIWCAFLENKNWNEFGWWHKHKAQTKWVAIFRIIVYVPFGCISK